MELEFRENDPIKRTLSKYRIIVARFEMNPRRTPGTRGLLLVPKVENLEKSSIAGGVAVGGGGRGWRSREGYQQNFRLPAHLRPLGRANRIREINYLHLHKPP